ncbi:MAG: WD40 repeat domain-containing protein, partial [Cyanobacteria bacterium P01_H01_bin.150]
MKSAAKRVNSPAFQRARLSCLPDNLVKSGNLERYYKLLADFNFISQKINHPSFGVQALIEDYDLIDNSEVLNSPEYNSEKIKILKLIQGTLRLSSHVIAEDKNQLPGQLLGRLLSFQKPEIQQLLEQAKNNQNFPWLRPLINSLTPPGGALLRTFRGHSSRVNAVAIAPNGKQAISASADKTLKLWNLQTGEIEHTFTGHSSRINAVAIASNGKQAISASA